MKYRVSPVIFFLLFLFPFIGNAQRDSTHVKFHGSNTFVGQYSNMPGVGSEIPASYYRNDLKMTLTTYDVPISATFFITSMQRDYRQSINNFRIYLDVAALMKTKKLADAKGLVSSSISKLESAKGELEKSKDLLNTSVLKDLKNQEIVQEQLNKAKEELNDAAKGSQEDIEKAKAKYDELKAKYDELKSKYEGLKSKYVEAKSKLDELQAKIDMINKKIDQAKSLANSPDLSKKAESYGKGLAMSKMGRFLSSFSALEIGKCRPNYSELTLKGVAVSGVNIEFTPGLLYLAFATGTIKRSISPSVRSSPTFKQNLIFGKLGIGKKRESHLYLTFLKAEDKVNSLPDDLGTDTLGIDTLHIRPRSNYVLGTEVKLAFFKRKFIIEGEAAVSMLTRDTQGPELVTGNSDIPKWLNNFLKPNMSSSADFAYDVKSTLNLKTTNISIGIKMVGPGYVTLGNPNLINDKVTYEGKIDQTFAKNQVSLSAYYRQSHDNLVDFKNGSTSMTAFGIIAGLRFSKLPYLLFSYTPYSQKTESQSFILKNSVKVITVSTGYNYQIGKLRSNTMFSFFYQGTEMIMNTISNKVNNVTCTLNEEISFKIPLSLAAGASFNQFKFSNISRNVFLLNVSGTFAAFKNKWKNSLGVKYSNQDYQQDKLGLFLNSRVQLWKTADLEIQLEKNNFTDKIECTQNYNEFIARLSLEIRW